MNNTRMKVGAWSVDEHERCAESLISHGLSYESMSKFVGTRTPSQITKYYARKKRKLVQDSKKYIVQSDESEVLKDHSSEVKKYAKIRNRRKSAPPPTTTSSSRRGLQQTGRLTPVLATEKCNNYNSNISMYHYVHMHMSHSCSIFFIRSPFSALYLYLYDSNLW
mmetsp:Transcript_27982/g.30173  ORF Transcript_27982/g.30173 Transcript_27982/m.30173 type:complete len:165 (-) Transcript_27982:1229-1723(-)